MVFSAVLVNGVSETVPMPGIGTCCGVVLSAGEVGMAGIRLVSSACFITWLTVAAPALKILAASVSGLDAGPPRVDGRAGRGTPGTPMAGEGAIPVGKSPASSPPSRSPRSMAVCNCAGVLRWTAWSTEGYAGWAGFAWGKAEPEGAGADAAVEGRGAWH